jgi:hypothetical protein
VYPELPLGPLKGTGLIDAQEVIKSERIAMARSLIFIL